MTFHEHAVYMEAKREVNFLITCGQMITPKEAMYSAIIDKRNQTLWSVAFRIASEQDLSAEDLHQFLEKSFPAYAMSGGHAHGHSWDDHHTFKLFD